MSNIGNIILLFDFEYLFILLEGSLINFYKPLFYASL